MPSYEDIRAYFDESALLKEVVRSAASVPIVTGFTLDVDPMWGYYYDIENDLVDRTHVPSGFTDSRFAGFLYDMALPPSSILPFQDRDRGFRRRDLYKPVSLWKNETEIIRQRTGRERLPVVLTVVHRPLRSPRSGEVPDQDDAGLLQQLVRATSTARVLVRIEERQEARLALASGDQITIPPANSGTLGGVLNDQAGVSYGITCSHVAQNHDQVYDASGNQIGVCINDTHRVILPNPVVCDPVNLTAPQPIPSNGPDVNMLDAALIKLALTVTHPTIGGVAQALSPGQSVVHTGAATGTTRHWLGSLCLSYGFSSGGQNFCFRDTVELVPQPSGLFGHAAVPTQGDSGGWVLTNSQPPDWAGLFFGEDGRRGFLIRAKWVHDWAQQCVNSILTP
jgi:hypothetical protein